MHYCNKKTLVFNDPFEKMNYISIHKTTHLETIHSKLYLKIIRTFIFFENIFWSFLLPGLFCTVTLKLAILYYNADIKLRYRKGFN